MKFLSFTAAFVLPCLLAFASPAAEKESDAKKTSDAAVEKTEAKKIKRAEPELSAEESEYLKKYRAEQEAAEKSLERIRKEAPFQETDAISVSDDSGSILGFCVRADGGLAVISGKSSRYGAIERLAKGGSKGTEEKKTPSRVQWLSASGETERSVDLEFQPLAVNSAPDGRIFVTGQGKVAVFDAKGEKLKEVDAPHMQGALANREAFEEEVMERHEADLESTKEQIDRFEEALGEIKDKPEEELSKLEKRSLAQSKAILESYRNRYKSQQALTKEKLVETALANLKEIHRIAVSKDDVFLVTRETAGYGFCVWRTDCELTSPKKIVSRLAGCCGQMDVQCIEEGIAVAENSRHRVMIYDREGKTVRTFGKADRSDPEKGFGGCCNPMNTCRSSDGLLLTSESNGLVKGFKPDGELVSIYGAANVTSGCKNSSIGISPQGDRLYYFDVQNGKLLVLTKKKA